LAWGERLEEDLPSQWPLKTGNSTNTYIRKSRFQTYTDQMRKGKTLHTNKRGNTPKGNSNDQPICTECQCNQFHQIYFKGLKSTYRLQHGGKGRVNTPYHQ
jgi:hypothetical protein